MSACRFCDLGAHRTGCPDADRIAQLTAELTAATKRAEIAEVELARNGTIAVDKITLERARADRAEAEAAAMRLWMVVELPDIGEFECQECARVGSSREFEHHQHCSLAGAAGRDLAALVTLLEAEHRAVGQWKSACDSGKREATWAYLLEEAYAAVEEARR